MGDERQYGFFRIPSEMLKKHELEEMYNVLNQMGPGQIGMMIDEAIERGESRLMITDKAYIDLVDKVQSSPPKANLEEQNICDPKKWWLISDEDVQTIRTGLTARTNTLRRRSHALHALDSGLHETDEIPDDWKKVQSSEQAPNGAEKTYPDAEGYDPTVGMGEEIQKFECTLWFKGEYVKARDIAKVIADYLATRDVKPITASYGASSVPPEDAQCPPWIEEHGDKVQPSKSNSEESARAKLFKSILFHYKNSVKHMEKAREDHKDFYECLHEGFNEAIILIARDSGLGDDLKKLTGAKVWGPRTLESRAFNPVTRARELNIIGYYHNHGRKVPIAAPNYEWMKAQEDLIICSHCGKFCKVRYDEVTVPMLILGEPSNEDYPLLKQAYERAVITLDDGTYKCIVCNHSWNPNGAHAGVEADG